VVLDHDWLTSARSTSASREYDKMGAIRRCHARPRHARHRARSRLDHAAIDAANAWLRFVDAGKYGDSWTSAATLFKKAVTKEQWTAQAQAQ
jgi:hypothetical protein